MSRLIDADTLIEKIKNERFSGWGNCCAEIDDAPTVDAIPLDTKIVVQTYDEEHEEWNNEIMTIQGFLESGMCEIYREELRDQYE